VSRFSTFCISYRNIAKTGSNPSKNVEKANKYFFWVHWRGGHALWRGQQISFHNGGYINIKRRRILWRFQNINLPKWQNAPNKKIFEDKDFCLYTGGPLCKYKNLFFWNIFFMCILCILYFFQSTLNSSYFDTHILQIGKIWFWPIRARGHLINTIFNIFPQTFTSSSTNLRNIPVVIPKSAHPTVQAQDDS
jgi:hypothetical protein